MLWSAGARASEALTYVGVVGCAAGGPAARLSAACVASPAGLLVIKLQVFQTLSQGQLLLDSHPQQRVEGLLFILCSSQLPLHFLQLGNIFVTTARDTIHKDIERKKQNKTLESDMHLFALNMYQEVSARCFLMSHHKGALLYWGCNFFLKFKLEVHI